MIMKFLQKVPAGLMLVPLLMGAVIHTVFSKCIGNRWFDDGCIFQCRSRNMHGTTVVLFGYDTSVERYACCVEKRRDAIIV